MRSRYKILLIGILLCSLLGIAHAQQTLNIKGVIFKKNASERIAQVLVTDLNSKVVMVSDELGGFSIKAAIGDTLLIAKKAFSSERRIVTNADDMAIYMSPIIELNQVTIKEQSKKQELNDVMKQYGRDGIFNNGKSLPVWAAINSPITEFYNLFGKAPAQARRFAAFSKNELEANEVNRRYTKELVKSVTKLPDDELPKFMNTFTPSYEDIKEWNDYQLITYIKKSLSYYQKHKNEATRLPKLY